MSESATGTEVVPYEDRALYIGYDPDLDFRKLALESKYFTRGFRLLGKDALIGVPHIVIGVTYREGFPREGKAGDYVSVEAVVADAKTLASNPIKHQLPMPPDQLSVYPNECVVYNDSGTGVRRYLTWDRPRAMPAPTTSRSNCGSPGRTWPPRALSRTTTVTPSGSRSCAACAAVTTSGKASPPPPTTSAD